MHFAPMYDGALVTCAELVGQLGRCEHSEPVFLVKDRLVLREFLGNYLSVVLGFVPSSKTNYCRQLPESPLLGRMEKRVRR
jgi:hypothetical protein